MPHDGTLPERHHRKRQVSWFTAIVVGTIFAVAIATIAVVTGAFFIMLPALIVVAAGYALYVGVRSLQSRKMPRAGRLWLCDRDAEAYGIIDDRRRMRRHFRVSGVERP
ncbi:MAG: hypothetical protein KIT16_13130 [Rhodospirillaceae bacterium]|nr:hypothetical protein [Rhodospirillaceae bacterium]